MAPAEKALYDFAASVGMKGDITKGMKKDTEGQIVEIDWSGGRCHGMLPTVALNMPYLRELNLRGNYSLHGENTVYHLIYIWCPDLGLFLTSIPLLLSTAGDVTQLLLPASMEKVNLALCREVTGAFLISSEPWSFIPLPSCGCGKSYLPLSSHTHSS